MLSQNQKEVIISIKNVDEFKILLNKAIQDILVIQDDIKKINEFDFIVK